MVERTYSLNMPGTEVSALKQTLFEQQNLLQKLQHELDAEREAAATSASEALSMILRLQGEKAALSLEASQYKRMAEEKMCHVETSLALFEDMIYQKEMDIASLEYQVQAYRCKLLSLGYGDMKFPENYNAIWQTNDGLVGPMNGNKMRGLFSLPAIQDDDSNEMRSVSESERSLAPSPVSVSDSVLVKEVIEQSLDSRKSLENCDSTCENLCSCLEQIKKLDERVKEITDFRDSLRDKYEIFKQDSESPILDSHQESNNSKKTNMPETREDSANSSKVQDVFEVPQTNEKVNGKFSCREKNIGPGFKDVEENLMRMPKNSKIEVKSCKPPSKKKSRARAAVNSIDHQAELQELRFRIERIEGERSTSRPEIIKENQEEEASLLMEIKEQLISVQSEIRSLRTPKKSPPRLDDSTLLSVKEAMLYFWL